jgi:hypothetical protein
VDHSAELRIPTRAVPARIGLSAHTLAADLFVLDEPRQGREQLILDLLALLDDRDNFVPVREANAVRLVPKHAIRWVAVPRRHPAIPYSDDDEPSEVFTLYDTRHRVSVELPDGPIIGLLLDSAPANRPRVVDQLNRARRFLRLWTADEQVLINLAHIQGVTELPEVE